jgi:hypothetical protein
MEGAIPKEHAEFLTITCLEWKPLLAGDNFKDIITTSLTFAFVVVLHQQTFAFVGVLHFAFVGVLHQQT